MKRVLYLVPVWAIAVLMFVSAAMAQTNQNQSGDLNVGTDVSASDQGSSQDPSSDQAPSSSQAPSSPDTSTGTANSSPNLVNIESSGFDPADITIAPGTTVKWTNMDTKPHTVTLDDGSFDSKELQPGDFYSVAFGNEPGTWTYRSTLDSDMTGSVTVGGDSGGGTPGSGEPGLDATQPTGAPAQTTSEPAQPAGETIDVPGGAMTHYEST